MPNRSVLVTLSCIFLCATTMGQGRPCPSSFSGKLICGIPEVYGVNGLTLNGSVHKGHFESSFVNVSATPLSSAIGIESTLLPLASPASGITFTWDSAAKAFHSSTDSLGPILGERAETIGKHKLSVGFGYQYFKFDAIDGLDLRKGLPVVLTHQDDFDDQPPRVCSVTGDNITECGFVRDIIKTNNKVDLKIHQFTTFVTFGLTDRIDLSVAVPFENVRLGVSSDATIVDNSQQSLHTFTPPCDSFSCSFSDSRAASGIGDVTLRVKGTAWKGERAAVALGTDVRFPTGDELNFLGSGAFGVRPFVVWSYRYRISPHALLGYETNSSSVLSGDISTGTKGRLPSQVTYSGGADVWLTKRLTVAMDLVGQQVNVPRRLVTKTFTELGACKNSACDPADGFDPPNTDPNISQATAHYNATNASLGMRVRPFGGLLITGNVTFKLNDGGLRAKVVPLVAVSYTF